MRRMAVVTGRASDFGRATAELLAAEGVSLAVLDLAGDEPKEASC